jgi:hypothetical protein
LAWPLTIGPSQANPFFANDLFSNTNKQHGKQWVFVDALFQLDSRDKAGWQDRMEPTRRIRLAWLRENPGAAGQLPFVALTNERQLGLRKAGQKLRFAR